jgi:TRAP-type mannitol/chloroaromatic compound transport system substrate-binding protein
MKKSLPLLSVLTFGLIFGGPVESINTKVYADGHAKNVSWNLSTWGKRRAFTEGIEAVSKYVADKSGGHFTIKINYGGTLSKPRENLDGISLGAFEACNILCFISC